MFVIELEELVNRFFLDGKCTSFLIMHNKDNSDFH